MLLIVWQMYHAPPLVPLRCLVGPDGTLGQVFGRPFLFPHPTPFDQPQEGDRGLHQLRTLLENRLVKLQFSGNPLKIAERFR